MASVHNHITGASSDPDFHDSLYQIKLVQCNHVTTAFSFASFRSNKTIRPCLRSRLSSHYPQFYVPSFRCCSVNDASEYCSGAAYLSRSDTDCRRGRLVYGDQKHTGAQAHPFREVKANSTIPISASTRWTNDDLRNSTARHIPSKSQLSNNER